MQTIYDFIEQKIKEKGFSKKQVYNKLGMTEAGFKRTLQNESISIKKYQSLSEILDISPSEFFQKDKIVSTIQYKNQEKDDHIINMVKESEPLYKKSKEENSQILELMQQNSKLIDIIKDLTSK